MERFLLVLKCRVLLIVSSFFCARKFVTVKCLYCEINTTEYFVANCVRRIVLFSAGRPPTLTVFPAPFFEKRDYVLYIKTLCLYDKYDNAK